MAYKKILLASCICLSGCYTASPWNMTYQSGSQKSYESSRLSYHTRPNESLALQIVSTPSFTKTYLEIHSLRVSKKQNQDAFIRLKSRGQVLQGIGQWHKGGHRVTLPLELQEQMIAFLLEGNPVTLELDGYSITLNPSQFTQNYKKLKKNRFALPIQLPFKLVLNHSHEHQRISHEPA